MKRLKEEIVSKYQLHKQHLLKQSQAETVLEVVEDILALHATSASTPYLSLFARMKNFQRNMFDRELYIKRHLIRLETLRGTLFITSTNLAPLLFQATRMPESQILQVLQRWSVPHSEYQKIAETVYDILKEGAKTLHSIKKAMSPGLVRTLERQIGQTVSRMTNVNIILTVLMRQGRIFSEKYSDPILTRHANRYALIRSVYPQLNLESLSPEEAQIRLIKYYIRTFGPVTEGDITWWTGFSVTQTRTGLGAIDQTLQQIRVKNLPGDYFMLASDYAKLKKFKASRSMPIILLPYEDPYTKGYQNRSHLVNADDERKVYIGGIAQPTILRKGKIVGVWNRAFEERGEHITIQVFQRLKKKERNTIVHKVKAISEMMVGKEFQVEFKE
jgi:hypothetical protein